MIKKQSYVLEEATHIHGVLYKIYIFYDANQKLSLDIKTAPGVSVEKKKNIGFE